MPVTNEMADRFNAALTRAETAADKLEAFADGDENATFDTPHGPVKSAANALNDVETGWATLQATYAADITTAQMASKWAEEDEDIEGLGN